MKKLALALAIVGIATLSACDKKSEPAPQAEAQKPAEVATVADIDPNSPTISIWTAGMKLGATLMLLEHHPKMDEKQQACLLSAEANPAYFENSKREMLTVLGIDGIRTADAFYTSDVGKKIAQYSQEQMAIAAGAKVENPTKLTAEEEVKRKDFLTSAIMVKMQQNIASISPQKMEADLRVIAASEGERCGLGKTDFATASTAEQSPKSADKTDKADSTDKKTNKK